MLLPASQSFPIKERAKFPFILTENEEKLEWGQYALSSFVYTPQVAIETTKSLSGGITKLYLKATCGWLEASRTPKPEVPSTTMP